MAEKRKISLVLADVDGTLVNEQKVLTRRTQAAVHHLREMGIVQFDVDAAQYDPNAPLSAKSQSNAERAREQMKAAHQAAAYDKWFRAEIGVDLDFDGQALFSGQRHHQRYRAIDGFPNAKGLMLNTQLPGFHFGDVEYVVDQRQQMA